jgi:hypothetical protein
MARENSLGLGSCMPVTEAIIVLTLRPPAMFNRAWIGKREMMEVTLLVVGVGNQKAPLGTGSTQYL